MDLDGALMFMLDFVDWLCSKQGEGVFFVFPCFPLLIGYTLSKGRASFFFSPVSLFCPLPFGPSVYFLCT